MTAQDIDWIDVPSKEHLQALSEAFDLVKDKQDWRAEVHGAIPVSKRDIVEEAIIHYTGTVPEFHDLGWSKGEQWLGVYADGYRNGPCGP